MQVTKGKTFYGVWILAGIWLIYFLAAPPGSYATSIISTHMVAERGWSESVIGISTSIFYLSMSLVSVPTGILIRQKGIRFTIVAGAVIGIAAYAVTAFGAKVPWMYVSAFGGIGISSAMCAIVTGSTTINTWFDRNKAMPMSILITAGAIGGFLVPILVNKLLTVGTTLCWEVFIGMDVAVILIAIFVLKDKPEDIGEIRDGHAWVSAHPMSRKEKELSREPEPSLRRCYHSIQFYTLSLQTFAARAANAGVTSYVIVYAIQHGISAANAALLITVYNVASLFGRFAVGLFDKKIGRRYMNAAALGLVGVECIALYFAAGYHSFCAAVAIGGCGFGALCTLFPLLEANYFGKENFALLNGTFNTIGTMGSFVSPMMIFAMAQGMGGYEYSYLFWGIVLAAVCVVALFNPVRQIRDVSMKNKNAY